MATIKFKQFLSVFPEIPLPVTLSEETHFDFSLQNDPLSDALIEEFIGRYEAVERDDLTEYVACFQLKGEHGYRAIVYWKASLLQYDYVLATYNGLGAMIDKRSIAGTKVKDGLIARTVATINESGTILKAEGAASLSGSFDPNATKYEKLEINEEGFIE